MNYQQETFAAVLDDLRPLLETHWREVRHFPDIEMKPAYGFYLSTPSIRVFTARDEGRLVGYAAFFVSQNKHCMDSLQAMQDFIYVHPEYRGAGVGGELIDFCDQRLRIEGCQVVYHLVTRDHNFGPLLERRGYELVEHLYAKRLDKEYRHG